MAGVTDFTVLPPLVPESPLECPLERLHDFFYIYVKKLKNIPKLN